MGRIVEFMEMRHYLTLARQYSEDDLRERITKHNRFQVRLTNMVRALDPTSKTALQHYAKQQSLDSDHGLAELLLNICFLGIQGQHTSFNWPMLVDSPGLLWKQTDLLLKPLKRLPMKLF